MPDAPAFPAGPVKLMILPRTRAGLDRAGLRQHLETVHGPLVVSEPDVSGGFTSYVHHYTLDGTALPLPELEGRDALTVICFGAFADMIASKASDGYRERVGPDEDNFRELEGSIAVAASETLVQPGTGDPARKLFVFRAEKQPDPAKDELAAIPGLHSFVRNRFKVLEGDFPFAMIDEIGLTLGADSAAACAALGGQNPQTRVLLTEPVRFLPLQGVS